MVSFSGPVSAQDPGRLSGGAGGEIQVVLHPERQHPQGPSTTLNRLKYYLLAMIKVGLLGCGNVGHILAKHATEPPKVVDITGPRAVTEPRDVAYVEIVAVYDSLNERSEELAALCGARPYVDFASFIQQDYEVVVEAASVGAVRAYAEEILRNDKDLVVLSVGALSEEWFRERITSVAEECGRRIYVPSGAIIGLDNLKIGQISRIDKLLLRSTKSPESLGIECTEKKMVFQGRAYDCIKQYPKNINVAVAIGLAAGREADVELWADPDVGRNIHEIFDL